MKKAAVVLDNWKLPIFESRLQEAGFTFRNVGSLVPDSITLVVEVEEDANEIERLAKVLQEAAKEAAILKRQGGGGGGGLQ